MSCTIRFEHVDAEGLETVHELPAKREVCPRCDGEGKHVNPSIDGNGITGEEMAELGDDFREDYLAGVYDVTCQECGGERVVKVLDRERCPAALLELVDKAEREEADYQAECAMERRMGA